MNKYKILKCMMPVILTAVLLMQSAFLPVTRIQTEVVTPDMSIINESERGHVEAWNPVYGRKYMQTVMYILNRSLWISHMKMGDREE